MRTSSRRLLFGVDALWIDGDSALLASLLWDSSKMLGISSSAGGAQQQEKIALFFVGVDGPLGVVEVDIGSDIPFNRACALRPLSRTQVSRCGFAPPTTAPVQMDCGPSQVALKNEEVLNTALSPEAHAPRYAPPPARAAAQQAMPLVSGKDDDAGRDGCCNQRNQRGDGVIVRQSGEQRQRQRKLIAI